MTLLRVRMKYNCNTYDEYLWKTIFFEIIPFQTKCMPKSTPNDSHKILATNYQNYLEKNREFYHWRVCVTQSVNAFGIHCSKTNRLKRRKQTKYTLCVKIRVLSIKITSIQIEKIKKDRFRNTRHDSTLQLQRERCIYFSSSIIIMRGVSAAVQYSYPVCILRSSMTRGEYYTNPQRFFFFI